MVAVDAGQPGSGASPPSRHEALIENRRVVPSTPGPIEGLFRDGISLLIASISRRSSFQASRRRRLRACSARARPLRKVFAYPGESGHRHRQFAVEQLLLGPFCKLQFRAVERFHASAD